MAFTCFLSDCHLSAGRLPSVHCFIRFISAQARRADALYILGDLLDCWLGDGIRLDKPIQDVQSALLHLSRHRPIYFIHGNHDFLLSRRFARQTGLTLLKPVSVIDLYGQSTLIMHGDLLCSDDRGYQCYRRFVQNPLVKLVLNRLPPPIKRNLAARINGINEKKKTRPQSEITDVNQETVLSLMRRHAVSRLIHGHTHRPAIHALDVMGKKGCRIVLGDWYQHGSVLFVDDQNRAKLEVLEV